MAKKKTEAKAKQKKEARVKKKTKAEKELQESIEGEPLDNFELPPAEDVVINIPPVVKRVLPVTISGDVLVAKPVPYDVAVLLSVYSPVPPRKGGTWTEKEKKENKKRERKAWKLGKRGHYKISLEALRMSEGTGYGIPSVAIMRAIQEANRIIPGHRIPEKLLNTAVKVVSHDPVKGHVRVKARRGPFMREDVVRVGHKPENNMKGTPSLTVRPCWLDWKIKLEIVFTQNLLDGEQVFNLLMWAGQCGILEGRPSRGSALNWGMFDVVSGKERLRSIG